MYDIAVNKRPSVLGKDGSGQSKKNYFSSTDHGEVNFWPTSGFDVWIPADGNMEDQIDRTSEVVLAYVLNRIRGSSLRSVSVT